MAAWILPACTGVVSPRVGPFAIITATGAFDDRTTFTPIRTGFAVLERHHLVDGGFGAPVIGEKREPMLTVFLSGASFDPEVDLQSLTAKERDAVVQLVRRSDLLIIQDLAASLAQAGSLLTSAHPSTQQDQFTFLLQRPSATSERNASYQAGVALGSRQNMTLQMGPVNLQDLGRVDIQTLTIDLAEGTAQTGVPPSTGSMRLSVSVPIISERLGMANLEVLRNSIIQQ